jgi:hypothetical protein
MNPPIYCNETRPAAKVMPINSIEILRAVPRMHAQLRRSKAAVRLQHVVDGIGFKQRLSVAH